MSVLMIIVAGGEGVDVLVGRVFNFHFFKFRETRNDTKASPVSQKFCLFRETKICEISFRFVSHYKN
jgi:hypothetical protein